MSSARKCFPNCRFETARVKRRQGVKENSESDESCRCRTENAISNCIFEKEHARRKEEVTAHQRKKTGM
jgi:hypothetical protein